MRSTCVAGKLVSSRARRCARRRLAHGALHDGRAQDEHRRAVLLCRANRRQLGQRLGVRVAVVPSEPAHIPGRLLFTVNPHTLGHSGTGSTEQVDVGPPPSFLQDVERTFRTSNSTGGWQEHSRMGRRANTKACVGGTSQHGRRGRKHGAHCRARSLPAAIRSLRSCFANSLPARPLAAASNLARATASCMHGM